jgi:hypothetical protein
MKKFAMSAMVLTALCGGYVCAEDTKAPATGPSAPAPDFTMVRGPITAVDDKSITVDGKQIALTPKTEIVKGTTAYTDALKVGQNVAVRVDAANNAIRIEVQADSPKKNGKKKKH